MIQHVRSRQRRVHAVASVQAEGAIHLGVQAERVRPFDGVAPRTAEVRP